MEAGRELDALIAEKVMGLNCVSLAMGFYQKLNNIGTAYERADIPSYSTDIRAAWDVAEKMRLSVRAFGKDEWVCEKNNGDSQWEMGSKFVSKAKTAPLAICLAALKAKGIDVEKI